MLRQSGNRDGCNTRAEILKAEAVIAYVTGGRRCPVESEGGQLRVCGSWRLPRRRAEDGPLGEAAAVLGATRAHGGA